MTENKSKEYAKLLREGRTSEATDLVSSSNSSKQVEEPVEQDEDEVEEEVDEPVSEVERFVELKGVGEELAEEMVQVFGSYDAFVEDADVDSLSDIAGIGESSAESLLEQVE